MAENKVIVITGAAGTGKTTVQKYLLKEFGLKRVLTHTTRPMRAGEQNGVDYYFEDDESFERNHYLERVSYSGYQYGSSFEALQQAWHQGQIATIVLETLGAITYAEKLGDQAVILFMTVRNHAQLKERMQIRGDNPKMIAKRLGSKEHERDLELPAELKNRAIEIDNTNWSTTRQQLDNIVKRLQDKD
ncbi:guanylate kinase [Lacticaseibacillus sharpeae]|uniref:guanylate kinase n=1 Tax=Lacticaseibacillus sharpeae TaxID=1626 RepID=UPI000B28262C|nr:AAA family ATPase [Lacticaseibacillus sharpeae]